MANWNNEAPRTESEPQITRRGFLKGLAVTSGVLLVGEGLRLIPSGSPASTQSQPSSPLETSILDIHHQSETIVPPTPHQNFGGQSPTIPPAITNVQPATHPPKRKKNTPSYGDTAGRSLEFMAANAAATYTLNKTGIRVGNAGFDRSRTSLFEREEAIANLSRMSRGEILKAICLITIGIPAYEEAAFRLAPSAAANALQAHGNLWGVGAATSAAFASVHGFKNKDGDITLPVPQFASGMFNWWLQRNRGYSHALLAHAINNTPIGIAAAIVYEKHRNEAAYIPQRKDPFQEMLEQLAKQDQKNSRRY